MKYLALALTGPIQNWGANSQFNPNAGAPRNTSTVPTLSGVLGLINSAMGLPRGEAPPYNAQDFHFIVRCDNNGIVGRDYQIAQRRHHGFWVRGNSGTKEIPKMFLQDASFTVLIGHDDTEIIDNIERALANPTFAPFLGRRAQTPSLPILVGSVTIDDTDEIVGVIEEAPLLWGSGWETERVVTLYNSDRDYAPEGHSVDSVEVNGVPLSHDVRDVKYGTRQVSRTQLTYRRPDSQRGRKETTLTQYERLSQYLKALNTEKGKQNVSY